MRWIVQFKTPEGRDEFLLAGAEAMTVLRQKERDPLTLIVQGEKSEVDRLATIHGGLVEEDIQHRLL